MIKNLGKLLNIKKEEYSRIIFLVIQALFYGIFISYFNSYISALFLSVFPIGYLTYAYLGSGIIGVISAYIFSFSLKNLSFKFHSTATLLGISVFILILKLGINYGFSKESLAFIGFIFYTPIASLITLVFSSLTMKLFDLRQGKRLFSLIASGSVIAAIISYLTVPLFLGMLNDPSDLLWFALIGVFFGGIIQIVINNKYSDYIVRPQTLKKSNKKTEKVEIFKDKYFKSIYVVSILSMVGVILISYLFLSASKTYFNDFDIKTLGKFFGLFFGITKTIEFIMNAFVSGKLLEKNGLKFGLSSLPISLLILSILALTASIFSMQFKSMEIVTFIFVVLSMLALIVVKRSLEDSAFKLLFQPLSSTIKSIVQSHTEGKARQVGAILIGVILVIIQLSVSSEYIQIVCISLLVILCVFWIKSVSKVSIQYKNYISEQLHNIKVDTTSAFQNKNFVTSVLMNNDYADSSLLKLLLPGVNYLYESDKKNTKSFDKQDISIASQKKIEYIDMMSLNWTSSYYNDIIRLINDEEHCVVEHLLQKLRTKINSESFKDFIISEKVELSNRIIVVLFIIKYDFSNSKKEIELALSKNTHTSQVRNLILVDIISNSGFENSKTLLLNNLEVKNKEFQSRIVSGLLKQKVKSTESEYLLIKNKIEDEVSNYNWIITSLLDLNNDPQYNELIDLLELELENSTYRIFKLTALIYDETEISKIINIIQDDTSEKKILAIEMVDILFDQEFKEYLVPIIDDLNYDEKYQKLNNHFPEYRLEPEERLKNIINSQYERLNIWIRLKAMELLTFHCKDGNVPGEILSNIFNEDMVLREGAFYCLSKISNEEFSFYFEKETSEIKALYSSSNNYLEGYLNIYELYNYLKNSLFLDNITDLDIIKILRILDHKIYRKKDLISAQDSNYAFLIIDESDKIKDYEKLDTGITQVNDLILLRHKSISNFLNGCNDNIKILKIDHASLIEIIASSETLFARL